MELITIGLILRPRGVRGDVHVRSLSDFPERFLQLKEVYVCCGQNTEKYTVTAVKLLVKTVSLRFKGIDNCDDLNRLRGCFLAIPRKQLHKLPEDLYYIFDLIGCKILNSESEDRGCIKDIIQGSAQDLLVVNWQEKEVLIPFVPVFIEKVDLSERMVVIKEIEGLYP